MKNRQSDHSRSGATVLGIDVGGTNTVYGLVTEEGRVRASETMPTGDYKTADDLFQALKSSFDAWDPELIHTVTGIGIGVPNGNYYTGEVLSPPNLPWSNVNLVNLVADIFSLPCTITNDANAAALGELLFGAAKGMRHFVEITLGTGLGSGIVADGNIIYGHDGLAGEMGHMTVREGGRLCGCGRKGCLETYVSAPGLVRTARECGFTESREGKSEKALTARDVYLAARNGNAAARDAFRITGEILGRAMSDVVAILSPEAIVLFGGMAQAGVFLTNPAQQALDENVMSSFRGKTRFILSSLDHNSAAVLGAAALFFQR